MPVAQKSEKIFDSKPVNEGDPIPEVHNDGSIQNDFLDGGIDLMGGDNSQQSQPLVQSTEQQRQPEAETAPNDGDFLDLMGGTPTNTQNNHPTNAETNGNTGVIHNAEPQVNGDMDLLDLMGGSTQAQANVETKNPATQ